MPETMPDFNEPNQPFSPNRPSPVPPAIPGMRPGSVSMDRSPPILGTDSLGDEEKDELNEADFNALPFSRRRRPEAEMDMTPMVDVVFLLLIFFMITAAFGLQRSIEIPDPESDQSSQQAKIPEEKENNDVLVHVTAENRIFVEGEEAATQQELYAKLRDQIYSGSGRRVQTLLVQAESKALHEQVVRVLDAAAGVGFDSVRLQTE